MANRKPKIPIAVPSSGVRNDKNPMIQTPEMAAIGINCMFLDGTIRPRPAMTKEIVDPIGGTQLTPQYLKIYDGAGAAADDRGTAFIETSNGYMLLARTADNDGYNADTWALSVNGGATWDIDSSLGKVGGRTPDWMFEAGGFILASFDGATLYRAPVADLPGALNWTALATGMTGLNPNGVYNHYQYDYARDTVLMSFGSSSMNLWAIYNVTGDSPWTKENLIPAATALPEATATNVISAGGIAGNWYVYPIARDTGAPANSYVQQWLAAYPITWDGDTYNFDLASVKTLEILSNTVNPYNINPVSSARAGTAIFNGGVNAAGISKCIFLISASGNDYGASIELGPAGFDYINSHEFNELETWGGQVLDYFQTQYAMIALAVSGKSPYTDYRYPNFLSSVDGGENWMRFIADIDYSEGGPPTETYPDGEPMQRWDWLEWRLSINDQLGRFFVVGHCIYDDWVSSYKDSEHPKVFVAPVSTGGGSLGDVTTLYQTDLSDEANVLIIGTTKAWARLNRATNQWVRITADESEQVDHPAPGNEVWIDDDGAGSYDIPPLSAYLDDPSYVDGVSIDGTYGDHPWVFRTFEAQGETFLIGTNGQSYPLIYHPDMPGGLARRLGELTDVDPNFVENPITASYLANGNLAPKARCIASAANRIMLANDPGGNGFEVSVSAFNDPDRGWADEQFVLLADTPGKIVSMNEISALQVAIYKEDAIYHGVAQTEFLGVSAPFRFELAKAGVSGPCSPNAVLRNFDGRQIYLARDGGVYMYDGVAPLDGGRNIRQLIQGNINLSELGKVWGAVDTKRKLVWFFYPGKANDVNKGIVISTDQGYPWPVWPIDIPTGWDFSCGSEIRLEDDIALGDLDILGSYADDRTLSSFSSGRTEMLVGLRSGVFFSHKYEQGGQDYNDDGIPINIHLRTGWHTPGGAEVYTADTLHHIFSSSDPAQELEVRLRAQQLGRNIRVSKPSPLYEGKTQRRTRHRVSGSQFAVDIQGQINKLFHWGGGMLSITKRGGR